MQVGAEAGRSAELRNRVHDRLHSVAAGCVCRSVVRAFFDCFACQACAPNCRTAGGSGQASRRCRAGSPTAVRASARGGPLDRPASRARGGRRPNRTRPTDRAGRDGCARSQLVESVSPNASGSPSQRITSSAGNRASAAALRAAASAMDGGEQETRHLEAPSRSGEAPRAIPTRQRQANPRGRCPRPPAAPDGARRGDGVRGSASAAGADRGPAIGRRGEASSKSSPRNIRSSSDRRTSHFRCPARIALSVPSRSTTESSPGSSAAHRRSPPASATDPLVGLVLRPTRPS